MTKKVNCKECEFWEVLDKTCRFNPPTVTGTDEDESPITWFPETTEDNWCGKFKTRYNGEY